MGSRPVTFLNPAFLPLGVALLILVVLAMRHHAGRRRRLAQFLGGNRAAQRLSESDLYRLHVERILLLGLASLALGGAAAEARWQVDPMPPPPRSVVVAIDVSVSMQASDVLPTRLGEAVEVASDLVRTLGDDRVGLLLFAGSTYSLAPPTTDHSVLSYFLSNLPSALASAYDPGTLFSAALRDGVALALGSGEPSAERAIVLIGDGEVDETEEAIFEEVSAAVDQGISVYTIGVGTDEGGEMIVPRATYQFGGPVVDADGTPVTSQLNEELLESIAEVGGGRYAHASDSGALRDLHGAFDAPGLAGPSARYQLTLLLMFAALAGLFIESLLDIRLRGRAAAPARRIA